MATFGFRPFSLDPLIAEAKRRMRRRRLLTAAIVAALAAGAAGANLALTGRSGAHGPALTPAASSLPPLSSLAARAFWCGDAYNASGRGGCHSPDGRWGIVVANHGTACTLTVTSSATGRPYRIDQPGSCVPDLWVGDRFVVQVGIYGRKAHVVSIDPASRSVTLLARFKTFVVSPNRRWIAGEARAQTAFGSSLVAVVSLQTRACRVVARTTSPNRSVSVDKSPWSLRPRTPTTPFRDPVVWRTVVEHGRKIRVVSGPGTGFTRNSRSVIVAKWENTKAAPYFVHKRLIELDLSSLRRPCPTGLAPRG